MIKCQCTVRILLNIQTTPKHVIIQKFEQYGLSTDECSEMMQTELQTVTSVDPD